MRKSFVVAIAALALFGLFSHGFATGISAKVRFVTAQTFPRTNDEVGGLSGLSLDATGTGFVAMSDRGTLVSGRLERVDGDIRKIIVEEMIELKDPNGRTIKNNNDDSEGLAIRGDGRVFVSFEGPARVWTYSSAKSEAAWLPRHPNFKNMSKNGALEALAIAPDGALFTLPEGERGNTKPHVVYRYSAGKWGVFGTINSDQNYLPVGADFGPDGKFYLLERSFSVLAGFQSRVRRFDVLPDGFGVEETLWESKIARHGNLEGLSVWRDQDNAIRLTMISDDNFKFFLRGEIVEYVVTE